MATKLKYFNYFEVRPEGEKEIKNLIAYHQINNQEANCSIAYLEDLNYLTFL
jgi:hypothetical protein